MRIRRCSLLALAALQSAAGSPIGAEARRPAAAGAEKPISDSALLAYFHSQFDQRSKMGKHEVLGRHQKALVVVDFPCSDVCPQYTKRIIHYDVPADPIACARVGGVIREERVPVSIAVMQKPFCLPRILATAEASEMQRHEVVRKKPAAN